MNAVRRAQFKKLTQPSLPKRDEVEKLRVNIVLMLSRVIAKLR